MKTIKEASYCCAATANKESLKLYRDECLGWVQIDQRQHWIPPGKYERKDCDKCMHKLACLVEPECKRTFEAK